MGDESLTDTKRLTFSDNESAGQLFGDHNRHLKRIAEALDIAVNVRGTTVFIQGEAISARLAENILNQLYDIIQKGYPVYINDVDYAIRILSADAQAQLSDIFLDRVFITATKKTVSPKSPAQKAYIDAMSTSLSASDQPVPVRHTWPWPWRSLPF